MGIRSVLAWGLIGAAFALGAACSSDGKSSSAGPSAQADSGGGGADSLYVRLGKASGIEGVVTDFLASVKADPKINGYFLNSSLDQSRLSSCLVKQIGSVTGGAEKYDCKSMKDAHANLNVSQQDFDDLVGHLSDALVTAHVEQKDIDTVLGVLGPMSKDIVKDKTNDATIYQRIGRKAAIEAVVTDFHDRVMKDAVINSFFATTNANRLATCLVRQVCGATGGPCKYGEEILDTDGGLKSVCRTMKDSHTGLAIAYADFQALVGDLVAALDAAKVPTADKDAILGVLGPMCPDIVEKDTCP